MLIIKVEMAEFSNKSPNVNFFVDDEKFNYGNSKSPGATQQRKEMQEALVRSDESDPNVDMHQDDVQKPLISKVRSSPLLSRLRSSR